MTTRMFKKDKMETQKRQRQVYKHWKTRQKYKTRDTIGGRRGVLGGGGGCVGGGGGGGGVGCWLFIGILPGWPFGSIHWRCLVVRTSGWRSRVQTPSAVIRRLKDLLFNTLGQWVAEPKLGSCSTFFHYEYFGYSSGSGSSSSTILPLTNFFFGGGLTSWKPYLKRHNIINVFQWW